MSVNLGLTPAAPFLPSPYVGCTLPGCFLPLVSWHLIPGGRSSREGTGNGQGKEYACPSSPTPVFLPGESQGRGNLVGCRLWGHTESDTTEGT